MKKVCTSVIYFVTGVIAGLIIMYLVQDCNSNIEFQIRKTQSGYDIYKNNRIEWEFTSENTDSLSLETLKMIFEGD